MKEAVDDIMVTLNEAASEVGLVGGMVDAIAEAMSKVGLHELLEPSNPVSISLTYHPYVVFSEAVSQGWGQQAAGGHSYIQHIFFFFTINSSAL